MQVIAEGVEELADLAALLRAGVSLAQGWLFARPSMWATPLRAEVRDLIRLTVREASPSRHEAAAPT
jgi:EAL domain-containing protein (putative c-di-GMP-specific phosphodiesterase class I)